LRSDDTNPEFNVDALIPEWLRPGWDEAVAKVMEDWGDTEPGPDCELVEVREFSALVPPAPPSAGSPRRLVVSVEEAARMLGCGRTLLYELIRTKQLPIVKVGRLTRIRVDAIEEFTTRNVVELRSERRPWWEDLDR
jgi:excisionase family DNA binding protein